MLGGWGGVVFWGEPFFSQTPILISGGYKTLYVAVCDVHVGMDSHRNSFGIILFQPPKKKNVFAKCETQNNYVFF